MKRLTLTPRTDWRQKADAVGFAYAHADGSAYWDESAAYSFTLREIESDIEAATIEIAALCDEFVNQAVNDELYLRRLGVPFGYWNMIADSWKRRDKSLYGRFDLSYSGLESPKLLEFNADTPTALYECAVFQWLWLEDLTTSGLFPKAADQFNSLHDKLVAAFLSLSPSTPLHMTAMSGDIEDRKTVEYLRDCALSAGHDVILIDVADIGRLPNDQFVDIDNRPIERLFKLYPWEWLIREPFGVSIPQACLQWIEPPWRMLLSTKALLPELWRLAPGHPNLLEAYHENDADAVRLAPDHVSKPIFSREGSNVRIVRGGLTQEEQTGPYASEPRILQALAPPAVFDGRYPVLGSWLVDGQPAGLGVREGDGPITTNSSRFVPHVILD